MRVHLPTLTCPSLGLPFFGVVLPGVACGAVIDIKLTDGLASPQIIGISARGTVKRTLASTGAPSVREISGAWASPVLTHKGASFSYTFTSAGFFVYRTPAGVGSITISAWTNSPPAIEIFNPIGGFYLPAGAPVAVQAALASTSGVSRVDFLADSNLVATAAGAPYQATWAPAPSNASLGAHSLVARLVRSDGSATDSAPVGIWLGGTIVFGPRRLPGGEFVCYWCFAPGPIPLPGTPALAGANSVPPQPFQHQFQFQYYDDALVDAPRYGILLDTNATSAQRFYMIILVGPP